MQITRSHTNNKIINGTYVLAILRIITLSINNIAIRRAKHY